MAKQNYEHVHASAGFSGERWDVNLGYNVSYASPALDVTFVAATKKIQLSTGTFPAWMVAGKTFVTDSVLNPGPFTIMEVNSSTEITVLETVAAEAAVTVNFNGSANTLIQDTLLKDLAPLAEANLTEDAPHLLVSSGALGGNRILNISALEVESAVKGGRALKGRFFQLSVQNSDVNNSFTGYSLTVKGSGTVNGAASLVITSPNDYWFTHDQNGNWIATLMPSPGDKIATTKRIPFAAGKWNEGANKNTIRVLQSGIPGLGEIGPHELANYDTYQVQVWDLSGTRSELVDAEIQVDKTTGDIIIQKASLGANFAGEVIITGTLD
jgi:hypothetical protein